MQECDLLSVEQAVKMQASDTAVALGFADRGRIEPGLRADLNIIDYDALGLFAPEVVSDLPTGRSRLLPRSTGYRATIVNGRITYEDGTPTGELPGRLVRRHESAV